MDNQAMVHQSQSSSKESNSEYEVGNIVWAKLVGCPFWPAIVTYDPVSRLCIKSSSNKEKKTFALHVRFCNYYGQRNWVRIIEKYCSKEDLVSKHPDCMVSLKKNKKEMFSWLAAVEEADNLMCLERKERILRFFSLYKLDLPTELDVHGFFLDPAPKNSNLNSSAVFHDATPVLTINTNIQNTITSDHDAADWVTIADLLIDKYGICQNDAKTEMKEIDFHNLKPMEGGSIFLPTDLKNKIREFEKNQKIRARKEKEMNSRRL